MMVVVGAIVVVGTVVVASGAVVVVVVGAVVVVIVDWVVGGGVEVGSNGDVDGVERSASSGICCVVTVDAQAVSVTDPASTRPA